MLVTRSLALLRLTTCKYSQVRSVKLAYNVFETANTDKSAPPLIIMHGLFGSKQNWRGISKAMSSKINRKIYTVDARNHGDSPHTPQHSSAHMADDVVELMRSEGMQKAAIMGHSMGGRTMMYLALKYPNLVDRAIIVDISPMERSRSMKGFLEILNSMDKASAPPNLPLAEGRVLYENQIKNVVGDKGTVDFIMMNLRKRDSGEFYWAVNVPALRDNFDHFRNFDGLIKSLPPFAGPVMFICGNQSDFVDRSDWPKIQKIFTNAEIHWLNTGHLVHFEQPVQFMDLVIKFLQK